MLTEGFFWIPSLGGPTTIAARQSGSGISWLFPFVVMRLYVHHNHESNNYFFLLLSSMSNVFISPYLRKTCDIDLYWCNFTTFVRSTCLKNWRARLAYRFSFAGCYPYSLFSKWTWLAQWILALLSFFN